MGRREEWPLPDTSLDLLAGYKKHRIPGGF